MEWIPGAIQSLYNQFIVLFVAFVLLSLLLHTLLFNYRTRRYRKDFHRMKEKEKEWEME